MPAPRSRRPMNVLVACERSGTVRDAFRRLGHEAWSCDLEGVEPGGEWPNYHLYGDCRWFLDRGRGGLAWDLLIAHPPCTYLCSSGLHWCHHTPAHPRPGVLYGDRRREAVEGALEFVRELLAAPVPRIAIENPAGCIGTCIRKADQKLQPYEFGDDASKGTYLWLVGLPRLVVPPGQRYPGRWVMDRGRMVERWGNQTDSGQNRLGPSPDRAMLRAETWPGIARAMAMQWGGKI